jgi:hypothetical protein
VTDLTLLDPTAWILDQVGLDRVGNREIQMDLFYDYRTNVPLYPEFQAFFRKCHQRRQSGDGQARGADWVFYPISSNLRNPCEGTRPPHMYIGNGDEG